MPKLVDDESWQCSTCGPVKRRGCSVYRLTRSYRKQQRQLTVLRTYWLAPVEKNSFYLDGFSTVIDQLEELFGEEAAQVLRTALLPAEKKKSKKTNKK